MKRRYSRWEKWLTRFGLIGDYHHFRFRTHCTLMDIQRHVPPEVFENYFKFAIVRHPWSRLKSEYRFFHLGSTLHDNRSRRRHQWIKQVASFEEFVLARVNYPNALQFDMLKVAHDRLGVDFVGKTEQLEGDFRVICDRLKVWADLPRFNTAVEAPPAAVSAVDTDSTEVRRFFVEHWQADLDAFGYAAPFPRPWPG